MKVRHPRAHPDVPGKPPARVDTGRDVRELDDEGCFQEREEFARGLADRHGVPFEVVDASVSLEEADASAADPDEGDDAEPSDSEGPTEDAEADTCDTVKSDGEVCGRDTPCPYHD